MVDIFNAMNTDQIAAEAANKLPIKTVGDLKLSIAIIKSAIEKGIDAALMKFETLDRAAHASEQGADTELVREIAEESALSFSDERVRYVEIQLTKSTWSKLQNRFAALSQRPKPATASELKHEIDEQEHCERCGEDWPTLGSKCKPDSTAASEDRGYPSDQQILCDDKPDSATASEIVPAGEVEGKYHGQFDMKPDSASTGKDARENPKLCELASDLANKWMPEEHRLNCQAAILEALSAATPSGGGEWTDETVKAIFDAFWPGSFFKQVSAAHNAALRENNEKWRKEVKQFIERQHSLRDCGNDTKRVAVRANDLMREAWDLYIDKNNVPEEYAKAYSELLFQLDRAALLETGEQKVDWLRAAAGPTEEQQTGEQTKEKE